ncbi:MAG: glycosyltransferase family 39 protein [Aggregatilineales bacterium]
MIARIGQVSKTKLPALWWIALTAILLLAVLMRLWSINKESFWADEGWTMALSHGPTLPDVIQTMVNDQHPPLYFALFHYWTLLVGNSEIVSRLFSAFWSLIGVASVYRLGADWFSRQAGALGALFMAFANLDLMMAQETRHYTQMATLAMLSAIFYLRYVRRPTRARGIGWWAASVALMYTHYLGALVLLIQLLHFLFVVRPYRRVLDLFVRWVLIGVAWLPWGFVFVAQSLVRYTRPILFRSALPNTPDTVVTIRANVLGAHFGLTGGLLVLGLAYLAYTNVNRLPTIRFRPALPTIYLALWVILPVGIMFAINIHYEIVTPRNFLLILPAVAVLIGHGLTNLERTARLFIVAILIVIGLTTVDAYFVKPPWRQVALDIVNYRLPDEPVIMDVWVDDFALRYHIGRDYGVYPATLPLISVPEWLNTYGDGFLPHLLQYISDKQSLWMADWSKDEDGILGLLNDHGFVRTATQIETHLDTNLIRVYRYDRVPTTPPLATYGNLITLARAEFSPTAIRGETFPVSLWWVANADPGRDYSVSAFLLNSAGQLVAQHDGSPLDGKSPTSGWHSGDLRFDQPHIPIPANLPPGDYELCVKAYWYADPTPLLVKGGNAKTGVSPDGTYLVLGAVAVR